MASLAKLLIILLPFSNPSALKFKIFVFESLQLSYVKNIDAFVLHTKWDLVPDHIASTISDERKLMSVDLKISKIQSQLHIYHKINTSPYL